MITHRIRKDIRCEVLLYRVGDDRRLVNLTRVTSGERTKSLLRHSWHGGGIETEKSNKVNQELKRNFS